MGFSFDGKLDTVAELQRQLSGLAVKALLLREQATNVNDEMASWQVKKPAN